MQTDVRKQPTSPFTSRKGEREVQYGKVNIVQKDGEEDSKRHILVADSETDSDREVK